ncbi:YifB family Mg chelatase-like AAA ATPase [Flexibacterium corallicola]|uniref:YifB family Mg chelatase-like AAA ATPase n=1 Tax=Flexibacterium corallicola TaxID=3037259 RepID=UPI00286F5FCC|nr:YifB family Mg chelatase-like AAA ATPase [Pseudovibrio sp. M1P-2-3]
MFSRVATVAFQGVEAVPVDVQVQIGPGAVQFGLVGLADKAVTESRERVRSALFSSGLALPAKRVTVNLAPADLPKEGSHYDLPIVLGLMCSMELIPQDALEEYIALGELSLDGNLAPITGILPAAIAANGQGKGIICPAGCGSEAAWADHTMSILAPRNLLELLSHFKGSAPLGAPKPKLINHTGPQLDLSEIRGQESAKRALEVAAAGGHNMLMVGPPGSGKSMLASRLPSILPELEPSELLEVSMISSIAGELKEGALTNHRPFRCPHHSASMAALVGGGLKAKPGEISLAHNGVLFLDELPEFAPQVLDGLRQPIESGEAVIVRANHRVTYPSRVQIIAAMNPCRCGYAGEPGHQCKRGDKCASDYQARVSGPFLDRIDMHVDVPAVSTMDLMRPSQAESSEKVLERVQKARERQRIRYAHAEATCRLNSQATPLLMERLIQLDKTSLSLLHEAAQKLSLSARGYHRTLKLALTIADLAGEDSISPNHLAEALSYKALTRLQHAA